MVSPSQAAAATRTTSNNKTHCRAFRHTINVTTYYSEGKMLPSKSEEQHSMVVEIPLKYFLDHGNNCK